MPFVTSDVTVTAVDAQRWDLATSIIYRGSRDEWIVPAGYRTDFATVPRIVVWLIPRFGVYTPAAILHDYLLTDEVPAGRVSPVDADGVFRRVLRELGVSAPRRWLMWAGVRWGALGKSARRPGWWRTAPAVLGVSVLALPVVLPGALGCALGLLLYWPAEYVAYLLGDRRGAVPRMGGGLRT